MNFRSLFMILLLLSANVAFADSASKTESSNTNTNPKIEIYPGLQNQMKLSHEDFEVRKTKRLLELLQNLRDGKVETVIEVLEKGLNESIKTLQNTANKSAKAKEALKLVEQYQNQVSGK